MKSTNMNAMSPTTLLSEIKRLSEQGVTFGIITLLSSEGEPDKFLVTEDQTKTDSSTGLDEEAENNLRNLIRQAISKGKVTTLSETVIGGKQCQVAIEIIRPKPSVIVFGAGHVGQSVALMANMVGYAVTAVDDREAFANRSRIPDPRIALVAEPYERAAKSVQITSNTAVVIVTRGHQYDELCLRAVIDSGARYIGMIGSRRRVISVFKQLTQSGVDAGLLERVHAPIGLAIGARSPQEIAVAILGEIIQTFNAQAAG